MNSQASALLSDADIAHRIGVSKSCIRGQRFKRRHNESHWFVVDPVYVGKCPRYREYDVEAWLTSLSTGMVSVASKVKEQAPENLRLQFIASELESLSAKLRYGEESDG